MGGHTVPHKEKRGRTKTFNEQNWRMDAPEFYFKEWEKVVTTRAVYVTFLIDCIIFLIALTPLASIAVHVCL